MIFIKENEKIVFEKTTRAMQKIEFKKTVLILFVLGVTIVGCLLLDYFSDRIKFSDYSYIIVMELIFILIAIYFYFKSKSSKL